MLYFDNLSPRSTAEQLSLEPSVMFKPQPTSLRTSGNRKVVRPIPAKEHSEFFRVYLRVTIDKNTYGLLTKREVKMTGYWPSSFFACLWTETKSRSINTQKKNEANIQSS